MEKIKKIMLGHIPNNIEIVVITPLKSTFNRLKEVLNIEKIYNKAFFENCIFKIEKENKKGMLILSPQGIASKDIIELFDNTNILFFGLAGSLNKKFKIGSFVEVKTAEIEDKKSIDLITTERLKPVKCGYSPCLIGTIAKKYCDFAKSINCDVVDMETAYCAKTAIENNNKFTSLLLISDIPGIINFWELSSQMQTKLKQSRKSAIGKIQNYIDIMTK